MTGDAEQVVDDQHLRVAIGAGADADGGRFDFRGNHGCDLARNAFKHNAADAGAVERNRIAH